GIWRAATSDIRNPPDTVTTVIRPLELGDRNLNTSWAEGAVGAGRGEFVTARIDDALPLKGLRLFPGRGDTERAFETTPKPTELLIGLSNGRRFTVRLPPASYADLRRSGGLTVEFPSPERTTCVSVMILGATAATGPSPRRGKYSITREYVRAQRARDATAFSEITPLSVLHDLPPSSAARLILDAFYEEDSERKRRDLAVTSRPYARFLVEELREEISQGLGADKRVRVVPLLAILPSKDAVPLLIELFEATPPGTDIYRQIKRALAAHREAAALPLISILKTTEVDKETTYADLVRLIGRVATPEQLAQLIPKFGQGGPIARNERIRAVAAGDIELIPDLLAFAKAKINTPAGDDALRALSTIGRRALKRPELTELEQEVMLELPLLAKTRRTLLRTLQILERFRPDRGLALLADSFIDPELAQPLVRAAAVRAAGKYESADALEVLERGLKDPSPDVRIEAILALKEHPEREEALPAVLTYVVRERWSAGLDPALTYLASLDSPLIDRRLHEIIGDQTRPRRAYIAARSMERARRGVRPEVAVSWLFLDETPYPMRRQLLELLGYEATSDSVDLLLRVLQERPFERLEGAERAETLRREAILALGNTRDPRGVPLLLNLAQDDTSLKVQRTALRALSFYSERSVADALKDRLRSTPDELRSETQDAIDAITRRADVLDLEEQIKETERRQRRRERREEQSN
ncbi:MAG: HEAT repeat domain-containing protein, partial [Myxococcota bacterium]